MLGRSALKLIEIYVALTTRNQPDKGNKAADEDADMRNEEDEQCRVSIVSRPISTRYALFSH